MAPCRMRPVVLSSLGVLLVAPWVRADSPDDSSKPPEKVWVLTSYLKGTAPQVREQLQRPVDEFLAKTADARAKVEARKAEIARARKRAAERARQSPDYKSLAADLAKATAALKEARAHGSTADRLAASSTFNKVRAAMTKLEDRAAAGDRDLPALRQRLGEEEAAAARCAESLRKTRAWRDELIDSIAQAYMMRGRLEPGLQGTLGRVKVLDATGDSVVVEFFTTEQVTESKVEEGIEKLTVRGRKEKVLVDASEIGRKAMPGDHVRLDRNFVITDLSQSDEGRLFTALRKPADCDRLLEAVMPLMGK